MGDFKEIHRVERGIQTLVALVVGAGMEQTVAHALVVVAVQQLADEEEIGLERIAEGAQTAQEIGGEAVGNVQPQAVDVEVAHPAADAVEDVVDDRRVVQIELDELVMALPAANNYLSSSIPK